ncbi:hypothetical protein ACI3LY_003488 [Candidozyma auris]|uniref:Uncharacterized protein n=2 Tax=Candidozyma auris TaxID=498019 RepID=A0AB36W484_CANAR|nr:hypothetical protein QG37_00253 [[Candida] auris]PIS52574.1 hypothetical protein CJI97_002222 [[Candida] auris]PIS54884.1 hypothetical protein B9J08_002031 [[Candida] auris]QWW24358.1 hypothetical protein CA7LBN_003192 [[Candida] auris]
MLIWFNFVSFLAAAPTGRAMLKLTSKNYPPSSVSSLLLETYRDVYKGNLNDVENFISRAQSMAEKSVCVEQTSFRYFLESAHLSFTSHAASECRLNRNDYYQTVTTPFPYFHSSLYDSGDQIVADLRDKIKESLTEIQSDVKFSDFSNLNYDLQCYGDHYELVQVTYEQTIVVARVMLHVRVPSECSFSSFDPRYDELFTTQMEIEVPVNGLFVCTKGRTKHCSNSKAVVSAPKFRSPL